MNKLQEAYLELQAASGIKAGDEVRVLRRYSAHEGGTRLLLGDRRLLETGEKYYVQKDRGIQGFALTTKKGGACEGFFPFFCLEKVADGTPPLTFGVDPVTITGKQVSCQGTKGTFEQIEAIYKAMLKNQ